jgi:carboxypeptidase C (cathepsin A)
MTVSRQWTARAQSTIMSRCDHVPVPGRRNHLQNPISPIAAVLLALLSAQLPAAESVDASVAVTTKIEEPKLVTFKPELQASKGTVTAAGKRLDYDAYAGTLVVHLKGYDDVPQNINKEDKIGPAEASMFYVAYFKSGAPSAQRPITFLFNGGPGSPTVWLHMGAFGPRRVVTSDDAHTPAAPYDLINNDYSLLDASDLVFIDAPGTGFSRVAGKDKEKAFFGVDPDAHAFAEFITSFLSKWGRWNSPKYIFGESYGTTRAANVVNLLETGSSVDVNGVILLSQCLSYDVLPDYPELNPAVDQPYELWLPSYAATAWYHHRLTEAPKDLPSLVEEVERFASGEYASALQAGAVLDPAERSIVAQKLHTYTGIPLAYIEKANLRISAGEFRKTLLDDAELTTGELDTRFSGPTLDPMSKEAGYDPQSAAIGSAYISVFNDYVRKELRFGEGKTYRESLDIEEDWDFSHRPPGARQALKQQVNVMPDLASAMKHNPNLKILVNGGYFDLSTPFFEGIYEMRHLPIPATLQKNIDFRFYDSGHMVYAHEASLKALHDNVADFIRRTLTH